MTRPAPTCWFGGILERGRTGEIAQNHDRKSTLSRHPLGDQARERKHRVRERRADRSAVVRVSPSPPCEGVRQLAAARGCPLTVAATRRTPARTRRAAAPEVVRVPGARETGAPQAGEVPSGSSGRSRKAPEANVTPPAPSMTFIAYKAIQSQNTIPVS